MLVGNRVTRRIISGGAFVALVASAGCYCIVPAQYVWHGPVEAPQRVEADFAPPADAPATPPVSAMTHHPNAFGELNGVATLPVAEVGQANLQQHTFINEGFDADVAVDPTGQWMVYVSTRHNVHPEIYMQRVDGLSVVQLTHNQSDEANPCFSPDGQKVAFASNRSGSWDLYVMDRDGRNVVQVTSGPTQDLHPTWSPDGSMLCYSSLGSRSGQWELWTVNLETLERRMIGFGLYPSWSPDRSVNRIAFQRARERGSRWFSLWTLDLVDGEARRMTEVAVSGNAALVKPTWSPDGKQLAFAAIVEPNDTAAGKTTGRQDIWVVNADGSGRRRLTDGSASNLMPHWSVENRVYFVSDRDGRETIWSVRMDPTPEKVVATASDGPLD